MRRSSLVLLVWLIASSAQAAIAKREVAEGHTSSGSASSCVTGAFVTSPVSGDTIMVAVSTFNSSTTITAPTDTQGNTYTQIGTTLAGGSGATADMLGVWRKENATGGAAFTVTGHVGVNLNGCTVIAWALSGANTPTSYNADTTSATNAGSTNPASGTSTPAPAANSFFIGAMTNSITSAVTAGSGWQFETRSTQTDNTTFQDLFTEDLTGATSSSAQSATFTEATGQWAARVASFAPSGGAVAPPTLALIGVGKAL